MAVCAPQPSERRAGSGLAIREFAILRDASPCRDPEHPDRSGEPAFAIPELPDRKNDFGIAGPEAPARRRNWPPRILALPDP